MTTGHGNALVGWPELWSLREDVQVDLEPSGGPVRLRSQWGNITVQRPSPVVREALHRMRLGPISLENAIAEPARPATAPLRPASAGRSAGSGAGGTRAVPAQRALLYRVLERLQPLVVRSLGLENGQPLLSVVPLTPRSRFQPVLLDPDVPVRLSAYAELRTNGNEFRLESPLSLHRVLLHQSEAMCLIGSLSRAITPAACVAALPYRGHIAAAALAYLAAVGMVVQADPGLSAQAGTTPVFAEDSDGALAGWSPTDMMFHSRSTFGRHDQDVGATYPLGERRPPEPVVKPPSQHPGIPLYRPRWDDLRAADPPLTVAIEGRRSVRSYGTQPMTATQLGELLYRAARVRSLVAFAPGAPAPVPGDGTVPWKDAVLAEEVTSWNDPVHAGDSVLAEETIPGRAAGSVAADAADAALSDRPYPSGGACHELELYVTVGQCAGIPAGVYHYDPLGHRLEPVNADRSAAGELLGSAQVAANMDGPPQVLITMTARLRRLTWKYQGLAYALVLKHVGVMTQMLYLVATAMRLAACAVGSVNIDAAARAFGTDWRTEPGVGQFMIGSEPDTRAQRPGRWHPANDASWADRARADLRMHGITRR